MADVTHLRSATQEPDPDVVEALEEALKLARDGTMRSVTIVGGLTGNETFTGTASHDLQQEIGAVSFLLHTLCARQRDNRRET